jgi:hypothetical protein
MRVKHSSFFVQSTVLHPGREILNVSRFLSTSKIENHVRRDDRVSLLNLKESFFEPANEFLGIVFVLAVIPADMVLNFFVKAVQGNPRCQAFIQNLDPDLKGPVKSTGVMCNPVRTFYHCKVMIDTHHEIWTLQVGIFQFS